MGTRSRCLSIGVLAGSLLGAAGGLASAGVLPAGTSESLVYRHIGPAGNRISAVTGVAGNPNVYFVGAASGGIFKSEDGGGSWEPVFDDQPVSSIGALAVAPSDPNVVWAGTGETFLRSNVSMGNGVYRSTDGGRTWEHMGLEATGRIGRIVIHPRDPDLVYVAALGHAYGPQSERGIYRSRDGGRSWQQILFVDEETGASDLVMDPNNPRILFAGMWQIRIRPWGRWSGGPGSGLYVSRDGGDHWERLEGHGLPEPPWGKIGLAMSAADSDRVYALIETSSNRDFAPLEEHQGVLWRSDDGGREWTLVNSSHALVQRPLYYSRLVVAPDDADEVRFLSVDLSLSLDGGRSFREASPGGDHHDLWIDPLLPERMIVGHDQGVSLSTNRGRSWRHPQLPTAQVYHVATDDRIPYFVYGNRQDGGSLQGPSDSLHHGGIPIGAWRSVGGCETGFALPVPDDPDRVWTGCYDGSLDLFDAASGQARDVSVWPLAIESWPAADLEYRFQWTFPIAISPHDPSRVYVGSQYVHLTENGGQSWSIISPDLTGNDRTRQQKSGGLTPDDAGPTIAPVVFAIAESPVEAGVIWAGTNDGHVQLTRDGGGHWRDVSAEIPDLPVWGTVSNIEPSRHAPGTAYLTVDAHQMGDFAPYVYRTLDFGRHWRRIVRGLPRGSLAYAHCVREDPETPGLLFLGTESGLHVSFDAGESWEPLQSNLPHAPVYWITVQPRFGDLVVATYGRGFWILDDIWPLRRLADLDREIQATLLPPRLTYRFRRRPAPQMQPGDPAAGTNPPYGALIDYYLASAPAAEAPLEIAILDAAGRVVRTLDEPPATPGLHRVRWDLRGEESEEPRLRTLPAEHSHTGLPEQGWRPLREAGRHALLEPPGEYTVRLRLGALELAQPLVVLRDPASTASQEDLAAQMAVLRPLHELIGAAARTINELEWARRQLYDVEARMAGDRREEAVREAAEDLDGRLRALEDRLFDLRLTDARQDTLRWRRKHYARLVYLARKIGQADRPPTDQQVAVYRLLEADQRRLASEWASIRTQAIPEFNRRLRELGVEALAPLPAPRAPRAAP